MTSEPRTAALAGLTAAGKSTYLGAMWNLIQDPVDTSIREIDTTGDRTYLDRLGTIVASLQPMPRTDTGSDEGLGLTVAFGSDEPVRLWVPDCSGESVRILVEDRVWEPHFAKELEAADAVLLFVSPRDLVAPQRSATAAAAIESAGLAATPAPAEQDERQAYEHRYASTQARLVDLFVNVIALRNRRPLRVALVVSCWDSVHGTSTTPGGWAATHLAGLVHFLDLEDSIRLEVFGVSAQGGDLKDDRERLTEVMTVRERAFARRADGIAVPLTEPLRWAFDE